MIGSLTNTKPISNAPQQPAAPPPTPPRPRFLFPPWLLALALVAATFLAYLPALRAGFIWDDDAHLTANTALAAHHALSLIWSSLAVARYYPLTLTTYWLELHLWGLHPLPYHLVNILLHAANSVVLFFLLRRLRVPAAWIIAMAWALHPVNVQSVAWIAQLKNVQSALFFFLALLFFVNFDEQKRLPYRWYRGYLSTSWYLLALAAAAAAILSEASTAVLPLALLLAVWWVRGFWERADAVRIIPFFGMAWLVSGLALLGQYSHALNAGPGAGRSSIADRLVVGGRAIWFYAATVLWPFHLDFVYPRWTVRASSISWWLPLAALVILGAVLWRFRARPSCRAALFAGAYFVVALLPALGLFNLSYLQYSFVADRFQYLASVAIILLVAAPVAILWNRAHSSADSSATPPPADTSPTAEPRHPFALRRLAWAGPVAAVAVASILATLGILTWRQTRIYQNSPVLWQDTLAKNPRCWLAHNKLGYLFLEDGNTNAAIAHYQLALQNKPDYVEALCNLGYILLRQGKFDAAIDSYEHALRVMPDLYQVHYNVAVALNFENRVEEAIDHYQRAIELKPDYAEAHWNLGQLLAQNGQTTNAIDHFEQVVQTKTNLPQLYYYLAAALTQVGRLDEAVTNDLQALQLKPDYADAQANLAYVFLQQGDITNAITRFERALQLTPDSAEAHYGYALALAQAGRIEEAFAQCEQALWLKPDFAQARVTVIGLRVHLPEPIQ